MGIQQPSLFLAFQACPCLPIQPWSLGMAQPSKRQRVSKLCGIGGVSDAALSRILNQLAEHPMVGTVSAQTCSRAAMAEYDSEMELAIDLPLTEEPWSFKWHVCKPGRLIQRCVEVSPALRRLFGTSVFMSINISRSVCTFCPHAICRFLLCLVKGITWRGQRVRVGG